ncbi:hypothetical protein [Spirosoma foliorum]|uniref:Uncharacterized protein n=1 Tax=Spirosoma foliorum TaxID=2710596 RepID=A0A7G5H2F4_9BACT|nr:hypothetical protein [Spirosoma foliorum]QMW05296.1 hypothetical protein H3H32_10625 [Spirosoma foliorum]
MATAQITLGTQVVTYNTDTLVITSLVDFKTAKNEAIDRTSFGSNDDVFRFESVDELDCIIFTSGDNYVGDYKATVDNYEA